MTSEPSPIAIYYEHPDWFRPLFAELERRGMPYLAIQAGRHQYEPNETEQEHALLFNRMSPSAYLRDNGQSIFYTLNYLEHLERCGVRVINGSHAFAVELFVEGEVFDGQNRFHVNLLKSKKVSQSVGWMVSILFALDRHIAWTVPGLRNREEGAYKSLNIF